MGPREKGRDPGQGAGEEARTLLSVWQLLGGIPSGGEPGGEGPKLGRYPQAGTIGKGGMGEILLVRDPELNRELAAKVLLGKGTVDRRLLEKFLLEAQVTGQLEHPNIVPVHELGFAPDGRIYFTMKRVRGRDLSAILREVAGEAPDAPGLVALLEIFLKICDAMGFAHSKGVIHRDLKPANVMVGEFGEVLVMDWGLAKVIGRPDPGAAAVTPDLRGGDVVRRVRSESEEEEPLRTLDGDLMGTPSYMPPEQARGEVDRLDERSDVYSLGAVLYEILALSPPYTGKNAWGIVERVAQGKLERPSRRAPERSVSRELEAVVLKAMAHAPERRYPGVAPFRADIEAYLAGHTLSAARYNPLQRAAKFVRRHKAASVATAVVLAILASLGGAWYLTPGTLRLEVSPADSRVWIDGEEARAGSMGLAAGGHRVRVEAPDHDPEERDVVIERRGEREISIELRHHQGRIAAQCDAPGARILVDGQSFGASFPALPFDTGRHLLSAFAPGRFEIVREVEVRREETSSAYFWLDTGWVWQQDTKGITGPADVVPDADGDGILDVIQPELTGVAIYSGRDGREIWSLRPPGEITPRSVQFARDLGGSVGKIWTITTPEVAAVFAIQPAREGNDKVLWRWSRPPRDGCSEGVFSLFEIEDLTGDGVRELVVPGLDGTVYVLDGREGRQVSAYPVSVLEFEVGQAPRTHEAASLFYASRAVSGRPTVIGRLSLSHGGIEWEREVDNDAWSNPVPILVGGAPALFWWSPSRWGLLDPASGGTLRAGDYRDAGTATTAPYLGDLDRDGSVDLLVSFQGGRLMAFSLDLGSVLWEIPSGLVRADALWMSGFLLATIGRRTVALDLATGRTRWEIPGTMEHAIEGDWDGDGALEILASMQEQGLVCLSLDGESRWTLRLDSRPRPWRLAPDLDGDGLLEIVVNSSGGLVGVVRGPRMIWERPAPKPLLATPLVLDGDGGGAPEVVQLGEWDGMRDLISFDGATGAEQWSNRGKSPVNRAPAVADWDRDGLPDLAWLYFSTEHGEDTGRAAVIRGRDGAKIASLRVATRGSASYATPAIADLDGDGTLDFALQEWDAKDVFAVSGRTGERLWTYPTGHYNMGGMGTADLDGDGSPDLVAPSGDGFVHAIRGTDGAAIWKAPSAGGRAPPALADLDGDGAPEVLVVSYKGRLHVLDGRTGATLWNDLAGGEALGRPAVARVEGLGTVIVAPFGGAGAAAIDWQRRAILWKAFEGRAVLASPVVADLDRDGRQEVVLAAYDGEFAVHDLATGIRLWGLRLDDSDIEGDPAVADLDGDGMLDIVIAAKKSLHAVSGLGTRGARARQG
ncbi:MAG: protein kinase [Planctomycetes bacterium]|nr:protein kinase [Planctomycetota bacterium]